MINLLDIYKNESVYINSLEKDDTGKCWVLLKNENPGDEFSLRIPISESRYQTLQYLFNQDVELDIKCNLRIESKIL